MVCQSAGLTDCPAAGLPLGVHCPWLLRRRFFRRPEGGHRRNCLHSARCPQRCDQCLGKGVVDCFVCNTAEILGFQPEVEKGKKARTKGYVAVRQFGFFGDVRPPSLVPPAYASSYQNGAHIACEAAVAIAGAAVAGTEGTDRSASQLTARPETTRLYRVRCRRALRRSCLRSRARGATRRGS